MWRGRPRATGEDARVTTNRPRARRRKGKAPHLSVLTQTNLKFVKMNSMRDPFAVVLLVVDRVPRRANS
jgi:hypothetical protein